MQQMKRKRNAKENEMGGKWGNWREGKKNGKREGRKGVRYLLVSALRHGYDFARQELREDAPDSPDVDRNVIRARAEQQPGRPVVLRNHLLRHLFFYARVHRARQPEVTSTHAERGSITYSCVIYGTLLEGAEHTTHNVSIPLCSHIPFCTH